MKKIFFLCIVSMFTLSLMAEAIPAGYYDAINGKQDSVLKSTLSQIIYPVDWSVMTGTNAISTEYSAGHRYKYSTRNVDEFNTHFYTWDGFLYTDTREDGTIWDMYSPYIHYMALDIYGAVSIPDIEIEHCFPKGWWGQTDNDAYKDLHHLNPANARANNNKSNYPPGYVKTDIKEYSDIFKMGKNSDYGSFYVFEPCDEYKGDFARAYFYIATAYEQFVWNCDYLVNTSYLEFKPWLQEVLVEWHKLDPVSEKEITRNNRVSDIQHNRNPFIDYPDLVDYIWGNKKGQAVDLIALTFTGDPSYELPVETLVSRALPATNISKDGFIANWKDAGKTSYELDVFTTETTGHNDTILNMPIFSSAKVKADTEHFTATGSYGTTGVGKSSVTFGTTTKPLVLTISNISIPSNCRITLRAMAPLKINNTAGAQMKISADGTMIANQVLTHNEEYYTFDLPAGTSNIVIEQGNSKLFNVQQLFIITGDEVTTHTSLAGYPKSVSGTSSAVEVTMQEGKTLHYTITPDGLRTSVPVDVVYEKDPTSIENTSTIIPVRKELRDGKVIILRNGKEYSTIGQRIK